MPLEFNLELPRRDFILNLQGKFEAGITGVFGPSGAGKTSFFHLLCGLEKPDVGYIKLGDRLLVDTAQGIFVPAHKRRIGVVFQDKRLFPHLTVRQNLLFGEKYLKKGRLKLSEIAELLDLNGLLESLPYHISGGEKQRVAIGRALLTSPELLLLDEPFNAVDNSRRITMLPYLKKIRDRLNIPMLVISHDLPDIQKLTSTVYLVEEGRCTGFGDIHSMMTLEHKIVLDAGLVNTFTISKTELESPALYRSGIKGYPKAIIRTPFSPCEGDVITLFPSEISLSLHFTEYISIQNQIPGTITKIISLDNRLFCQVDGDFSLTVEITPHAAEEMGLRTGLEVYCLFKANSLHE